MAARTAYEALDAATSPEPQAIAQPPRQTVRSQQTVQRGVDVLRPVVVQGAAASGSPGSRAGVFAPVRRASRAVSLEVTGSFFALFALSFSLGMWHARADVHAGPHGVARFAAYGAVSLFFIYCAVSSFVRAKRLK